MGAAKKKTRVRKPVTAQMGCIVTLKSTKKKDDIERRCQISDCDASDLSADPPVVCRGAALVRPFFEQEVGHEAFVTLNGKRIQLKLTKIEQPPGVERL
jgi:hypothetical protein